MTEQPTSRMLRVSVGDGCALDAGSWRLAVDDHQYPIAKIAPPAVPMFQ